MSHYSSGVCLVNFRIFWSYTFFFSLWAGHGSNVQGLETTATFVPETDEFELHTPTLTGSGPLRFFKC
jgi:hypothetical protein